MAAGAFFFAALGAAEGGTVHGTVQNRTIGQVAPGVELALIQLQGGMQEVAHAKSGPQGEFTFDHPGLGAQPMLVRAVYKGVNFNQAVPPGAGLSALQVEIYEPSKDSKTITVTSHVVIFQPNGNTLVVGEEYEIQNKSQPPVAYYRTDGSFDFALPEKGALQQVAAAGPTGMQVVQLPIDKKNNKYSIAFAFRPGENKVRLSYELPYEGNTAALKIPTLYPGGRLLVAAPPTVQVTGDGLASDGQEQGMNVYGREDVPAGTMVAVNLSGTAPPPSEAGGSSDQGQQGRDAQQTGGGEGAGASIQAVPGRLDVLKWPLIIGFVCLFGLGGFLLARKPVAAVVGVPNAAAEAPTKKAKKEKPVAATATAASAPAAASVAAPAASAGSNGPASLANIDAAVGTSLDALKERLFRLELRRQAGTITEEEYAQERAKAEKVLRDLVRG
jgi:hypothetical protein